MSCPPSTHLTPSVMQLPRHLRRELHRTRIPLAVQLPGRSECAYRGCPTEGLPETSFGVGTRVESSVLFKKYTIWVPRDAGGEDFIGKRDNSKRDIRVSSALAHGRSALTGVGPMLSFASFVVLLKLRTDIARRI